MARVFSSPESNALAAAEVAANASSSAVAGEGTNSSSQAAAMPPHIPQQQRIVCVPNQQAPYPHAPPQGRAKGAAVVVRHMTTALPTTSQASAAAAAPGGQQYLHLHKFQQQRPYATAFFSQAQMVATGGSQHLRQPHPILPMPLQSGAATTPRPPPPGGAASKSQQGTQVQRIPHPVSSPRYVNSGQAAGGVMSASASPQPHKLQGVHHFRVGQASNGSVLGKSPSWLPPIGQSGGGSSSMTPGESHGRDRPDALSVIINDRKVRLVSEADKSSLYSLCRRWVRNDVPRKDQMGFWDCVVPLPRPLSAAEVEKNDPSEENGDVPDEVTKSDFPVEKVTTCEMLEQHIAHFKNVRKRSRDEIKQRIARYRPRLALCLQRDYT